MKQKNMYEEPEDLNDLNELLEKKIKDDKNRTKKSNDEKKRMVKKSAVFREDESADDLDPNDTFKNNKTAQNDNETINKRTKEDDFDFTEEKRIPQNHAKSARFFLALFKIILYIVIICGLTYLVLHYVAQRTIVEGSSMETTLTNHDNLVVDKLTYRFKNPKRFDIIVFPYQHGKKVYYIKRIIGLPGETVKIDATGNIYINDKELEESYGMEVMKDPGIAANGVTLGKNEYFVLGDNRNDSTDSRSDKVGVVKKEDIIGKAVFRIYPLNKIGLLKKHN